MDRGRGSCVVERTAKDPPLSAFAPSPWLAGDRGGEECGEDKKRNGGSRAWSNGQIEADALHAPGQALGGALGVQLIEVIAIGFAILVPSQIT